LRIFDGVFLLVVSTFLFLKVPFLGVLVLVLSLLIQFQNSRVRFLLGSSDQTITTGKKIKALVLAVLLGASLTPLLMDAGTPAIGNDAPFIFDSLLPLVIVVALFSAAMMVGVAVEKRKR
jgi:hypothetical protein